MITHNDLNRSDVDFALEMIEKTVSRNAEFDSCEGLNHHIHREIVMETLNNHQVIITSADPHNMPKFKNSKLQIINL